MRRLASHLFAICSAISLVLFVAVCVLWARSHARTFELAQAHFNRAPRADERYAYFVELSWYAGTLHLRFDREHFSPAYVRSMGPEWAERLASNCPPGLRWHFLGPPDTLEMNGHPTGFRATHYVDAGDPGHRADRWFVAAPHGVVAALLALAPAIWLYRLRKARRTRRLGLCPSCGYDLRASPDRCPECGAVPERATSRPVSTASLKSSRG